MHNKILNFYKKALNRLSADERNFERVGDFDYKFSLYALAGYFFKIFSGDKFKFLDDKRPVLAAVSGGGDSVALLWLMRAFYDGEIIAAHVNHCIRGSEADLDEKFVNEISQKFGVKCVSKKINVPEMRLTGESLEAAARRLRHEWLISTAKNLNACGIALGHNRDDLAETVLFNILRGTGVRGGAGIPERRELFFRPLLGLRRDFLREILSLRGIPWREDSTNGDVDVSTRNFMRLELLPLIENKINADAIEHLADFGCEMRGLRDDEERRGGILFDELLISQSEGVIVLNREKIRALNDIDINLVIREAGRRMGLNTLSRSRTSELAGLIKKYRSDYSFIFQWQRDVTVKYKNGGLCVIFNKN